MAHHQDKDQLLDEDLSAVNESLSALHDDYNTPPVEYCNNVPTGQEGPVVPAVDRQHAPPPYTQHLGPPPANPMPPVNGYPQIQTQMVVPGTGATTVVSLMARPAPRDGHARAQHRVAISQIVLGAFTTCICFNVLCGIPAIILAAIAINKRKPKTRKALISASIAFNVTGIVITIIAVTVLFVLVPNWWNIYSDWRYSPEILHDDPPKWMSTKWSLPAFHFSWVETTTTTTTVPWWG